MNKFRPNFSKRKLLLSFLIVFFLFSFISFPKNVYAQAVTSNPVLETLTAIKNTWDKIQQKIADIYQKNKDRIVKVASKTFQSTLRTTLNTVAYDTATFLFSSGEGQKSLFNAEYLTEYAKNMGEAASMNFIDNLNKEWEVDLCRPSFPGAQLKMGLGLVDYSGQSFYRPKCTWQTLKTNYTNYAEKWSALGKMSAGEYLSAFSDSFSPTGNDVMVSLTLFDRASGVKSEEERKIEEQIKLNRGWLDIRNIGDKAETTPEEAKRQQEKLDSFEREATAKFTGDALTDAANIFLNQSLITAIKNLQKNLAKTVASNTGNSSSAIDFTQLDSSYSSSIGTSQINDTLKKILKPRFDVRADYDILAELTICLDKENPSPSNCVIDDRFSQAVQNRNSLIEAIGNGYINGSLVFNRDADYSTTVLNERSLMILRKFRIIPIGWEEALNRAEEKTKETGRYYTLMDMISCFSPNDEYETFSSGFTQSNFANHSWCQGLVDPTWILKSNSNYCKRQGFGSYIQDIQFVDTSNIKETDDFNIDPVIVSRSNNYCADEQSCIKERADGSCEYYGYCTEEKRIWNFGEESCDPVFNTCESFTSNSNGKKLALLKNTINYEDCSVDSVGCAQYANTGTYNATTKKVLWNANPSFYFNNKVETCSASEEGCQSFIRTTAGLGHNFVINGSFENDLSQGDWNDLSVTNSIFYHGDKSARIEGAQTISQTIKVAPDNHVIAGESYTLSFFAQCTGTSSVSLMSKTKDILPNDNFSYQIINYTFPANYSSNQVSFDINVANNAVCNIDAVKLERGLKGTFYSENNTNGLVYQKLIPDYLKSTCYINPNSNTPDYRLKLNAPEECFKYARQCNKDEIACRLFTSIYNVKLAAKAQEKDYCPEQCIGYDVYAQGKTLFEDRSIYKMIPNSAEACSAQYVGCTEFTNLDQLSAGGEAREYYTSIKHCIKPAQGNCQSFYSWAGSGSGYQLESYFLESGAGNYPKVTEGTFAQGLNVNNRSTVNHVINGVTVCSKEIFELDVSSPGYNSDCREFYTQDGDVIYLLYSRSITCSDDCKIYRMTEKNIDHSIPNATKCNEENNHNNTTSWDAANNVCYRCLGGGKWDASQNACLYQAIPGEGKTCPATANTCREYNGSAGNNVRNIASYDFNDGLNSFTLSQYASLSTESLNQGGKSLSFNGNSKAHVNIGGAVRQGKSYVIKVLLKNTQGRNMSLYFENENYEKSYFGTVASNGGVMSAPVSNEWQLYQFSLDSLNHKVSDQEKFVIEFDGSGNSFISNIIISEISEKYYLIKDSWRTPEICYYDTADNYRGVNYNLGCQKYTDQDNINHSLRQFSSLCSNSSLGCETMVKDNDFIIATYDSGKLCNASNVGCTRFGKVVLSSAIVNNQNVYQDVYLKNDPSRRAEISCTAENIGCDAWSSASVSGISYFKDPGDNLCQWRKGRGANDTRFAWYKKDVKKCKSGDTFTNNICLSNDDCVGEQTCELDTRDFLCPVENMKTIGNKGDVAIWQPKEEAGIKWAGLCPIKEAGCTEYIDPISSFSPNIILNPNFADIDGNGKAFDMWTESPESAGVCDGDSGGAACEKKKYSQKGFEILPNKLYLLETKGRQEASIVCTNPIYRLNSGLNTFSEAINTLGVNNTSPRVLFYSGNNNSSCTINYEADTLSINNGQKSEFLEEPYIQIREALVEYQLKQNLDFGACNGQADISKGCVVFNQREYSSANNYTQLNFDAGNYPAYSTCSGDNCNANTLIKVNPDRVCGRWLSCFSYTIDQDTGEKSCLQMMECSAFNYDGSCLNFSKNPNGVRTYNFKDVNASGYSVLGMNYLSNMNQVGRDEYFVDDFELGNLGKWYRNYTAYTSTGETSLKTNQKLSVEDCLISGPYSTAISGKKISYPASGKGFLKIGEGNCSGYFSTIEKIPLAPNTKYYLSFMVNTEELAPNEFAKVRYVAYNTNGNQITNNGKITNLIPKKNGWQDFVIEIETKSNWGSVVIELESTNNKAVYFDDFRITSVLERGDTKKTSENAVTPGVLGSSSRDTNLVNNNLVNNKFISPICRLYPSENSLSCESEKGNLSLSGWYGYCLQKDPKNPNVCLLWYPIDTVKGIKGSSDSSSAFTGYASTGGPKPYYCAEMSADFDLVWKVEPFFSGLTYWEKNNDSSANFVYSGSDGQENLARTISDGIEKYGKTEKGCGSENYVSYEYFYWNLGGWEKDSRYGYYHLDSGHSFPYYTSKVAKICQGASSCKYSPSDYPNHKGCGGEEAKDSWRYTRVICSMNTDIMASMLSYHKRNNSGPVSYGFESPFIEEDYSEIIARDDDKVFSSDVSTIFSDTGNCVYKDEENKELSLPVIWKKWNEGDERFFNRNINSRKPKLDLRVMAYDYAEQEVCESLDGKYFNCSSDNIICPSGRQSACLLEIDKYTPVCSKVVQGEIPWVQRLKTGPYNVMVYAKSANTDPQNDYNDRYFPNSYYLNTLSLPYGAVVTNGGFIDSTDTRAPVFAGSAPREGDKYGLPFSCDSKDRSSYVSGYDSNYNNCNILYFNGEKIVVAKNKTELEKVRGDGRVYPNISSYTDFEGFQFKNLLKSLWLKVSAVIGDSSYDNSYASVSNHIDLIEGPRTNATEFKAVKPKISNVTLHPLLSSGLLSSKTGISPSNSVYKIEKSGFYVLSFNTSVDAEQAPIKRLSVRIKSTDHASDIWDNEKAVINLYNVDPLPNPAQTHKIVRYLQEGDYYVLIKAEDNWGFYHCLGLPNSDDLNYCCAASDVFASKNDCQSL